MERKVSTTCGIGYFIGIVAVFMNLQLFGSELSAVEESPKQVNVQNPTFHSVTKRTLYYREKKQVAVLAGVTQQAANLPPIASGFLIFTLPDNSWVRVKLDNPLFYEVKGNGKIYISGSKESVTVVAASLDYFETFFFAGKGSFLDGDKRDTLKKVFFEMEQSARHE